MNGQEMPHPMRHDDIFADSTNPAHDVPNPSSQPSGAWPHRMVRHALASVATLGLNVPAPSIYSPSGCKYSRLDVFGHCDGDVSDSLDSSDEANGNRLHADGQADTAHDSSGADANHQLPVLNDDIEMMHAAKSPSHSQQLAWRTLAIVAADGALLIHTPFILTHDAATGYLDSSSGLPEKEVAKWAQTQAGNFSRQLECGARAFDVRPKNLEDVFI